MNFHSLLILSDLEFVSPLSKFTSQYSYSAETTSLLSSFALYTAAEDTNNDTDRRNELKKKVNLFDNLALASLPKSSPWLYSFEL